jgi:hypothetical protein
MVISPSTELLRDFELLAGKVDKDGHADLAEDIRSVVVMYLEPELKVRYVYANEWRTGTLLTRPNRDNPCWQIQRSGFGGWVDQVLPSPNTIRINWEAYANES